MREYDVIVVGGGQAALMAAISARELGVSVAILTKGRVGMGGASVISDGVYSAILDPNDSPQAFYEDILVGGRYLSDRRRAELLAEGCTPSVMELKEKYGLKVEFEKNLATPGHSFPRRCYVENGQGDKVPKALRARALAMGINFIEKMSLIDLIKLDGEINCVVALDTTKGEIVSFITSSVVLAFGGMGGLYKDTDNPSDLTGEGIGIAWRHGVSFTDMEFVQFYPYRLKQPVSLDLYTKIFGQGAKMVNQHGERFMETFPRKELETRDKLCHEMFSQQEVYLNIDDVRDEDLKASSPQLAKLLAKGYDGRLLMAPVQHFCMGGIVVNEYGETGVPGLFACGECTGGLHGANRLGGGALTETLVFGKATGIKAAKRAKQESQNLSSRGHNSRNSRISFLMDKNTRLNIETLKPHLDELKKTIKGIMSDKLNIRRSQAMLNKALLEIESLKNEIEEFALSHLEKQHLKDLIRAPWLITKAASLRTESRGSHRVDEFPAEQKEWERHILFSKDGISFK